ncbi:MAG: hypothetical protein H7X70_00960, partial [Candidatus Kapabacteria bacterium]|nr:hypothetical protein [Candidatus Kapabacteria bacterium]
IARERGLSMAPLSRMMTSEECANIIIDAIQSGRTNDVFTHAGTQNIAVQAVQDRCVQEDQFEALWLAMRESYDLRGTSD